MLPALPDAWPAGHIDGLRARGGFEVTSLAWSGGKLSEAKILSKIGGVLRVRSRVPILLIAPDGKAVRPELVEGDRENPNPLFFTPPAPPQLISPEAKPVSFTLSPEFVYDIATKAGETSALVAAR